MSILRLAVRPLLFSIAVCTAAFLVAATNVRAADAPSNDKEKPAAKSDAKESPKSDAAGESSGSSSSAASGSSSSSEAAPPKKPKYPPYAEFFRDADDPIPGLIKLRRKGGTLYAEISPSQLRRDFIVVVSIAKGIGRGSLLAGMSWNFGDDPVWQFRKVDDYIHVVRRNVRFSAKHGSPEEKAVDIAFTDSILFSLPIATVS